jgi:uncharacterized protein YlxW (UPF0749 family)
MSDERPVFEQDGAELKQTLLEVLFAHKNSIDAVAEGLRSQKMLLDELYDQAHRENARRNELTTAVNALNAKLDQVAEQLNALENRIIATLCKPVGAVC